MELGSVRPSCPSNWNVAAAQPLLFWRVTQQPAVGENEVPTIFFKWLLFMFFKGWDKHAHVFILHLVSKFLLRSLVFLQYPPCSRRPRRGGGGLLVLKEHQSPDSRPNRQLSHCRGIIYNDWRNRCRQDEERVGARSHTKGVMTVEEWRSPWMAA